MSTEYWSVFLDHRLYDQAYLNPTISLDTIIHDYIPVLSCQDLKQELISSSVEMKKPWDWVLATNILQSNLRFSFEVFPDEIFTQHAQDEKEEKEK